MDAAIPNATAHLEVRSLACSRGSSRLIHDLSFALAAGEIISVRGPNGSGKTTLLRCVAGLTRPDAGEILWNGVSSRADSQRFRADLLYAGHLPGIKDDFNAEENLASVLGLRGVPAAPEATREALEIGRAHV